MKRILFLSSVDFKEKSIQVIRKTPEAYKEAGWDVHYIVGRDNSQAGDYYYENVVNPIGISVYRFIIPLGKLHSLWLHPIWRGGLFRIRNWILVFGLAFQGAKLFRRYPFDVIYGYEISGVLAARLLRTFGLFRKILFITRFQGVLHVKEWLRLNQKFRVITNFEAIMALKTKCNLVIMTNDGSQGLHVLNELKSPNKNILFLTNGVEKFQLEPDILNKITLENYQDGKYYFISISRLDAHKRIDRGIKIVKKLVHDFSLNNIQYYVIGGGVEEDKLKLLISELQLENYVKILGPINHKDIPYHLANSQWLISMYTSSNVGNPLLEAIRMGKPVLTLNNGDTGTWIKHNLNGLIYDINDEHDFSDKDYETIASDLSKIIINQKIYLQICEEVKNVADEKLWTWDERMSYEVQKVTTLLSK